MKCATEMIISTHEDRQTAIARAEAEAERQRRLEEAKQKKIREEATARAMKIAENILENFEKQFRNWGGDPEKFVFPVRIEDITCKSPGYPLGNWYDNHEYYYPLVASGTCYTDGRISYDVDADCPIDLTIIIETLTKLCYKIIEPFHELGGKYHWGCGEIAFPSFALMLDPQCIEKK